MSIFKLADKFSKKYAVYDEQNADHYGVDELTGKAIVPEFENGDMVEYNGRKAYFLTIAYWSNDQTALIQYLDKKPPTEREVYGGGLTYATLSRLKLVQKKSEREDIVNLPKVAKNISFR